MVFFLSARVLKRSNRLVDLCFVQVVAQVLQARLEGVPAGVLAQHQPRLADADHLGPHDLVGLLVLEHAVLVDAGLVGKGIRADDGLIGLDGDAGVVADHLA